MRTVQSALALGAFGLFALALPAFWPTYLSKPFAPVDRYTHVHAALGAVWLSLLVAQALLIVARKRPVHRGLGRLSYVVAPLFALSGVFLAHHRFSRMDAATFEREAYTLYLPLSAALLFGAAYSLAMLYRRSVRLHGRFMLCTALPLVDPVVGRFLAFHVVQLPEFWHYQLVTFSVECGVLLALYRTLPGASAERRVFSGFAAAYAATLLLWFFGPRTAGWHAWAKWFRDLPIT